MLKPGVTKETAECQTAEAIADFNKNGVDQGWYTRLMAALLDWRKANRIEQRRNAARSRWKKSVDQRKPPQK